MIIIFNFTVYDTWAKIPRFPMWNIVNFGNYENCINFMFYDEKSANLSLPQYSNISKEIHLLRGQHCFIQLNFQDKLSGNISESFKFSNGFCVPRYCSPTRSVYWINQFIRYNEPSRNLNATFAQCKLQNDTIEIETIDYVTM